jgi:uncharacterized RDD family membrane protein YckC
MLPVLYRGERVYAGFWRRFGAFWVDALILTPLVLLILYINNAGRLNILYTLIPNYIFFIFYHIYCVKRWGGTPGKLILKIKIININGNPVGWKEAILRHLVDLLLGLPATLAMIIVMFGMTDDQFILMTFHERQKWIFEHMPFWYKPSRWINQIWIFSEFIVLLCNDRKRALHDFIAKTAVIKKKFENLAEQTGGVGPLTAASHP